MHDDDLKKRKCKNIGCNRVFRWREELKRQERECNRPKFQKIVKHKAENGSFNAWTASKNLSSNLMQVVILRIVKVKNRLSITHTVSAVKCFWKGISRATRRVLWMIILFHLLLLSQQTRFCQIKLFRNSAWVV